MKKLIVAGLLFCASSAFADTALTSALSACQTEGGSHLSKMNIDGTSDSELGYFCYSSAESLFNAMERYSNEYTSTLSTGIRVVTRRAGALSCNKQILNADGSSANYHWCIVRLDVDSNFVKALDL